MRIHQFLLILFLGCLPATTVFAQNISNDGFINYTEGNQWKYVSQQTGEEFTKKIIECTQEDTHTTCMVENFGELIIQEDSVFVTDFFADFFPDLYPGILKFYVSNFPLHSIWDACWDCGEGAIYGSEGFVGSITQAEVFGENVLVKTVVVKQFKDDPLGVPSVQMEIAEHFGILSIQYWHGDAYVLTGAVIEDEKYGDLIVSTEEIVTEPVKTFQLLPAYPNPFNPVTMIRYELPQNSQVRLEVFDMLGRRVAVLVDGLIEAGTHEIPFDASNLASGVYLYRLTAGQVVQTRQMVLVK